MGHVKWKLDHRCDNLWSRNRQVAACSSSASAYESLLIVELLNLSQATHTDTHTHITSSDEYSWTNHGISNTNVIALHSLYTKLKTRFTKMLKWIGVNNEVTSSRNFLENLQKLIAASCGTTHHHHWVFYLF